MLEYCPVGMEKHLSFHYLYFFMQRLPQALRTQPGEVQPCDPRALATRADKLWSVHSTAKGGTVAAAEAEETAPASIAAVRGGTRGRGGKRCGRGAARGGQRAQPAAAAPPTASGVPAADPTSSDLARASSGLCPSTGYTRRRRASASPPARGETRLPGTSQRRRQFFNFSSPVILSPFRAAPQGRSRSAHLIQFLRPLQELSILILSETDVAEFCSELFSLTQKVRNGIPIVLLF
jgi:hypothetical protein